MQGKNLAKSKFGRFVIISRTDCGVDFVGFFKKLISGDPAFPQLPMGGDPVNGFVRKVVFRGKNYVFKYEHKRKDRVENAIKSFFRGSHYNRLIRRIENSREHGFFNCCDVYLVAERTFFGVVRESYIIEEFLEGETIENGFAGGGELRESLVPLFQKMHAFGIVSGDPNPFNFLKTSRGLVAIDLPGKKASSYEKAEDWKMLEARYGVSVPADVKKRLKWWFKVVDLRMEARNLLRFLHGKEISLWDPHSPERKFCESEWTHAGKWRVKLSGDLKKCQADNVLQFLASAPEKILHRGRETVFVARFFDGSREREVVVKHYFRQGFFKSRSAIHLGSKAERAFRAAKILREHGVGTPAPLAVAERWHGKELSESFLITEFVPAMSNFREELYRIYRDEPDCGALMSLLKTVAEACWAFHESGIVHKDLGNQNIALARGAGKEEWKVFFIDLDRVRFRKNVSFEERGKDLARIDLPSDFRRLFYVLYFQGYGPPVEFSEAEGKERKAFARHSALRPLRHPIREWKLSREEKKAAKSDDVGGNAKKRAIPRGRDLWIWDEKSAQPIPPYTAKDRHKYRTFRTFFDPVRGLLKYGVPAWKIFKKFMRNPPEKCVPDYRKGVGMSLDPNPATWEMQLKFLRELQSNDVQKNAELRLPVLLRIYHHKPQLWEWTLDRARELNEAGHSVALALTQDRSAFYVPLSWGKMVRLVFERAEKFVDFIEVGHAINRSKWGIWEPAEYRKLLVPVLAQKARFPHVKITGPACIDFDLHALPAALGVLPKKFRFDALSHHLYVDRRGAPENFQGKFDTWRKCAWLSALAKVSGTKDEKIIVSEVNWPLLGVGEYSPVDSPLAGSGPWITRPAKPYAVEPPRVSEEDYADFMARYLEITLSSGFVSRVYWWRLCARGFGLVDDLDPENPRPRPAFFKLKEILLR